jgi:PRTRC genetic system protein C
MSSLTINALHREFFYNGTRIPDPAPNLTVEQLRELLTPSYPKLPQRHCWGRRTPEAPFATRLAGPSGARADPEGPNGNEAAHHKEDGSGSDPPARGTPSAWVQTVQKSRPARREASEMRSPAILLGRIRV